MGETIRAWAPGRVNLIGEHTDYNDGLVLPIAIDRGVEARVSVRTDATFAVSSRQRPGEVIEVDSLAPGATTGWPAYVLGAVWAVAESEGYGPGLDIVIDGDVPLGAGLSSSAAVSCSVAMAVGAAWGCGIEPRALARLAQHAENSFVGVPTGSMDQVASVMGREGCAVLFDVRDDSVEYVDLGAVLRSATLMVIDTRASHELVDGGYASRRAQCEGAAQILGVRSLRDVADVAAASRGLDVGPEVLTRRMRHVVTEIERVRQARIAVEAGDLEELGSLMVQSHASLRDDFEVSCDELDVAVESALAAGAVGARMTGGGFGGSAIALVARARAGGMEAAVRRAFAEQGWPEPRMWAVTPSAGARLLNP